MNLIGRSAPFSIRLPRVRSRTFVSGVRDDDAGDFGGDDFDYA